MQMNFQKFDENKDNVLMVGMKPFIKYAHTLTYQFKVKKYDEVTVYARGKFISKAIDVIEFTKRIFLKDENIQIKEIKINSTEWHNKNEEPIWVSIIEIVLVKGGSDNK